MRVQVGSHAVYGVAEVLEPVFERRKDEEEVGAALHGGRAGGKSAAVESF